MKNILDRIPSFVKSFYFLSSLFFVFWLSFIDSNDLFLQGELRTKQSDLLDAREFYEDKIMEVKNDREALLNNSSLLEKIAREKYLMKKDNEDLYILVD
ncbi:MAG: septum formation initiator family protein [Cyclobacteriaceae bacterium]